MVTVLCLGGFWHVACRCLSGTRAEVADDWELECQLLQNCDCRVKGQVDEACPDAWRMGARHPPLQTHAPWLCAWVLFRMLTRWWTRNEA